MVQMGCLPPHVRCSGLQLCHHICTHLSLQACFQELGRTGYRRDLYQPCCHLYSDCGGQHRYGPCSLDSPHSYDRPFTDAQRAEIWLDFHLCRGFNVSPNTLSTSYTSTDNNFLKELALRAWFDSQSFYLCCRTLTKHGQYLFLVSGCKSLLFFCPSASFFIALIFVVMELTTLSPPVLWRPT